MKQGDVISRQLDGSQWAVMKILEIDECSDGSEVFHCLVYEPANSKPSELDRNSRKVAVWHSPMNGSEISSTWEVLDSEGIAAEDLKGFHYFLKRTDFPRYLSMTGLDGEEVTGMANQYYQEAIVCGDAGELDDAIEGYTKAIEEFPLFYDAIDNRAFCYMEKGDYESALLGFEESLAINPDGIHAYFSRGECLLKLRRYDEAEEVFVSGKGKFPEHRGEFGKFLLKTKLSRTADSRLTEIQGRPWWKLW